MSRLRIYPQLIKPEDKVCYNCDNFVRNEHGYSGHCYIFGKQKDNEHDCKRFVKRIENEIA